MKLLFFLIFSLVCLAANGQNKFLSQLSDTDVIKVVVKGTDQFPIQYNGISVQTAIITGSVRKVVAFWLENRGLWGKRDCIILNALQCLEDLRKNHQVIMGVQGFIELNKVSIEFPDPSNFNNVKNSLLSKSPATCEATQCVTVCKNKVCISYECENELEICYNGEFSLSVTNGNLVTEATIR